MLEQTVSPVASSTSCGRSTSATKRGHELDDLIGERDHSVVVGGDDDDATGTASPRTSPEHALDLDVVEVRGGLVGEDQRRVEAERPRDGDALLLPAGQVTGVVMHALRQADLLEQLGRARRGLRFDGTPAAVIGTITFSIALRLGTRLNAWNTTPTP